MKERGRCSGCVIPRYLGIESEQEWIRRQQRTQIDELNWNKILSFSFFSSSCFAQTEIEKYFKHFQNTEICVGMPKADLPVGIFLD